MNDPAIAFVGFDRWLARWHLKPDGTALRTLTGHLLPVIYAGRPAMLKVSTAKEERDGAEVLAWWEGAGAVRVLAHEGDASLLERALDVRSLTSMAHACADDEATTVLCSVAASLHAKDAGDRPSVVVELRRWFRDLWPAAASRGGVLGKAAPVAARLLDTQHDLAVLHGDLHHGNVLDFGANGWLAIDPKGLYGERTFDFVNLLRNPDAELALAPGRFARQVATIARVADLDPVRLVEWTLAFSALSAAWIHADGDEPALDLAVAGLAGEYLAGR